MLTKIKKKIEVLKKKIKKKIDFNYSIKIQKLKKQNKALESKIIKNVLLEQDYIDKISLLQDEIRQLLLQLPKEDRECWLRERNRDEERNTPKKKRIKK